MSGQKRPTAANVAALLKRYQCPIPFHAVRARFMGTMGSPSPDRSPINAIKELWGGNFPPVDTLDDLNHLLHVLVDGLWNPLTAHQTTGNPFKLASVPVRPTRKGIHNYALVRQQEIEGFMDGLFGANEEIVLPESAHDGVDALGQVRAMLSGTVKLLGDTGIPARSGELNGLAENLQALAAILETEMNVVILSCTRARRQAPPENPPSKPTVH